MAGVRENNAALYCFPAPAGERDCRSAVRRKAVTLCVIGDAQILADVIGKQRFSDQPAESADVIGGRSKAPVAGFPGGEPGCFCCAGAAAGRGADVCDGNLQSRR